MGDWELKQQRLAELTVLLVTKKPKEMSEGELQRIMDVSDELERYLNFFRGDFPDCVVRERRYRARKAELVELKTEELQRIHDDIREARAEAVRADWHDDLPDSFFEGSLKDSDAHIVSELLKERQKAAPTAFPSKEVS